MSRIGKIVLVFYFAFSSIAKAQEVKVFELSGAVEYPLYTYYQNPQATDIYKKSSGSLIYNLGSWCGFLLGSEKIGIGIHGRAAISIFNFDLQQYKGLTAFNYGIIGSVYLGHPRVYDKFSIQFSGGLQWNRTELWIKPKTYRSLKREVFDTYCFQLKFTLPKTKYKSYFIRYASGSGKSKVIEGGILVFYNLDRSAN